ncbi:unnamed protein product [Periconia digitata]|uniref:Uncharacterized protein n=1 Tax=Periconia digitata TaxID=1303443 RepID=A0A9W4UHZ2_9PLEO|nr:unnamed protein product [Periconia digitata]
MKQGRPCIPVGTTTPTLHVRASSISSFDRLPIASSNMTIFLQSFSILVAISRFQVVSARHNGFRHEAVDASVHQVDHLPFNPPQFAAPNSSSTVLGTFFPSPNASPTDITAQSQTVTSFIPEMTWCVGPPIGLRPLSDTPSTNQSTKYETLTGGTGHCETVYVPTTTTVCATTLTGIATKITVSECDQEVTFSSECGFTLETPTSTPTTTAYNNSMITAAPTVRMMSTYWVAPWQSLTAGDTPSNVDMKVCKVLENDEMECTRYQEVWEVLIITKTTTSTHDVQLTTTVSGPGTLLVETMKIKVTDTIETIDLSTTLVLQSEIETESTSKSRKLFTRTGNSIRAPISTLYVTKTLKHKTSQ